MVIAVGPQHVPPLRDRGEHRPAPLAAHPPPARQRLLHRPADPHPRRGGRPRHRRTCRTHPWHPHHITERYGLFTLILLGESLLASANAIIEAIQDSDALGPLIAMAVLTLIATAALWWIYFWPPHHRSIRGLRNSLAYGYGHYFIFAAAGAFSAGIEAEIAVITDHSKLEPPFASFAYTIPIAVFILGVWAIAIRPNADRVVNIVVPLGGLRVLIDPLIPVPFALTSVILIGIVVVLVWRPPLPDPDDEPARCSSTERSTLTLGVASDTETQPPRLSPRIPPVGRDRGPHR